jgi:predicted dithiol-disulfide oxidoreductase (DUF899 family)
MPDHRIVGRDVWAEARKALLAKEKDFTRLRDELSRARREMPWERVEKEYVFEGRDGPVTLADLFEGRAQLVVYHFMFAPEWETGCKSCSFWADNFNGAVPHLRQRDVSFAAISRAPIGKLQAFARRMGWSFTWVSSGSNNFNFDYAVSFTPEALQAGKTVYNYAPNSMSISDLPGVSVFIRDESGAIFHTYSAYARGIDMLNGAYSFLDIVPKGRDEEGLAHSMAWVKLHDEYAA